MITVDFLLAVGLEGGVEKVVNTIGTYMHNTYDIKVRVVQLVWEGKRWVDEEIEYYPLLFGKGDYSLNTFTDAYCKHIEENGCANIVIATAMPYMCQVARYALDKMNIKNTIILSWAHAPIIRYEEGGFGNVQNMLFADGHLAISDYIRNEILLEKPDANIIKVNNPVRIDFTKAVLSERKELSHIITYIGRLSEEKNIPLIIEALSKVENRNWTLCVVGDGTIKKSLETYAEEKGVSERIIWKGWQQDPWDLKETNRSDFLVLSSEYEGFSVAMIEALAHGIPVISTPVSGATEVIVPGKTGYLFEHGDSEGLAKILNFVDEGKLPICSSRDCASTVENYEMDRASDIFTEAVIREYNSFLAKSKTRNNVSKISVIIPVFNAEKYIGKCLENVVGQDIGIENIELIIVDDCSTDNTLTIIKQYERKYPDNILLIQCEENKGPGAGRNIGLSYASGDFIAFIDADDHVDNSYLKILLSYALNYDCDIVACSCIRFSEMGTKIEEKTDILYNMENENDRRSFLLNYGTQTACWAKLYKKSFIDDNKICFYEGMTGGDILFTLRSYIKATKIATISAALYWYRENMSGLTFSNTIKNRIWDSFNAMDATYECVKQEGAIQGIETEIELIYYIVIWYAYILKVRDGFQNYGDEKDRFSEIASRIISRFPNILNNKYLLADTSENNKYCVKLLEEKVTEI